MAWRQALVAKAAVDFVDALESAHHKAFQEQFGRNAQVQIGIQAVVVGHERTRRGAAGDGVHHRRFHLQKTAIVEEAPQRRDDASAQLEDPARVLVGDEVQVALPIAHLLIAQAVVFLRQRMEGFGEEMDLPCLHRQFALVRLHHRAANANDVAQVPQFAELVVDVVAQIILAQIALDAAAGVRQRQKARLAHHSSQHDAAGNGGLRPQRFERLLRRRTVRFG